MTAVVEETVGLKAASCCEGLTGQPGLSLRSHCPCELLTHFILYLGHSACERSACWPGSLRLSWPTLLRELVLGSLSLYTGNKLLHFTNDIRSYHVPFEGSFKNKI